MASQAPGSKMKLEIRRTFAAPRAKVFEAWTQQAALDRWMCRDVASHEVRYLHLDVRPNGSYEIAVKTPEGITYIGSGIYREVKPPEKLVFTWQWKRSPEKPDATMRAEESVVTVEFFERGDSTEMLFKHELLQTEESRKSHQKGWEGCFDKLAEYLKK
jgi:uncharacterized protein YndB with AHSA1/START domain